MRPPIHLTTTTSTHNVYLTPPDADLADEHPFNRQVLSSKGLIADDQIPADSPLRQVYNDATIRAFLCQVFGIDEIHRVTPTAGPTTRILVVFAFNDKPGVGLSDSALTTFYGRLAPEY